MTQRQHGPSNFVETVDGESTLLRNRRHIKPLEPEGYNLVDVMKQGEDGEKLLSGMIQNLSKSLEEMDNHALNDQAQSDVIEAPVEAPFLNTRSRNRSM